MSFEYVDGRDEHGQPITLKKCHCGAYNALKNDACYACGDWLK